ncbi:MAG: aldehyde dehydrogenase family protein [Actinomycetota bacterium]|nr:aldehyde dehydrogenase family protein [Actinomycetota bacterium]
MTIDGRAVSTPDTIDVVNPATGAMFAEAPDCSRDQLNLAMLSAQAAFTEWKSDLEFRRETMRAAAAALDDAAEDLALVATMEQGMPLPMSVGVVRKAAASLSSYAELEVPRSVIQDDEYAVVEVVRRPLGVIAAIKPWNVPITMAIATVAPALRAGCTVVLKPSPYTPLATLKLGEALRDVLPPGVLNVVSGADPLGQWMTEHPVPRGISFTGSIATGKRVNETAARDLKRVLLELGGNDAAIVLDDVDPTAVADKLFWRAFGNAGQVCMAIKRVYVPERLHGAIVEALVAKARSVRVGNGLDDGVEMGPINNKAQFERLQELVADAVAHGAIVASPGNALPDSGYFFEPTILTEIADGTRLVEEEQFGPVLPVMPYRTVAEAIARANATHYGLGASVWSDDLSSAAKVAEQLEAGTVWINTHMVVGPDQPFGGVKWSGVGSGNGIWGVQSFTDVQTIYHAHGRS